MLSLLNKLSCKALVADCVECVACLRSLSKTHYLNGDGRTRLIDLSALVVNHDSDASDGRAGNYDIAGMERTVLDKEGSYGASVLVEASLYDYIAARFGFALSSFISQQEVLPREAYLYSSL